MLFCTRPPTEAQHRRKQSEVHGMLKLQQGNTYELYSDPCRRQRAPQPPTRSRKSLLQHQTCGSRTFTEGCRNIELSTRLNSKKHRYVTWFSLPSCNGLGPVVASSRTHPSTEVCAQEPIWQYACPPKSRISRYGGPPVFFVTLRKNRNRLRPFHGLTVRETSRLSETRSMTWPPRRSQHVVQDGGGATQSVTHPRQNLHLPTPPQRTPHA